VGLAYYFRIPIKPWLATSRVSAKGSTLVLL
jgi:hypothetical protein